MVNIVQHVLQIIRSITFINFFDVFYMKLFFGFNNTEISILKDIIGIVFILIMFFFSMFAFSFFT